MSPGTQHRPCPCSGSFDQKGVQGVVTGASGQLNTGVNIPFLVNTDEHHWARKAQQDLLVPLSLSQSHFCCLSWCVCVCVCLCVCVCWCLFHWSMTINLFFLTSCRTMWNGNMCLNGYCSTVTYSPTQNSNNCNNEFHLYSTFQHTQSALHAWASAAFLMWGGHFFAGGVGVLPQNFLYKLQK